MLPLLTLLAVPALAYTPAGFGVPEQGGALAGPSEAGAAGMFTNPAAAHGDQGSWLIDVGWMYSSLYYELEIDEDFSLRSTGAALVPSLAGTESFGPVGVGLAVMPLLARGGGSGTPEDGPQRFHSINGGIQLLELDLGAAVQVHRTLTLGGAFRYGAMSMSSTRALDAGVLIESLAGPDSGAPIGDSFLEGRQVLDGHKGAGMAAAFGVRWRLEQGPGVSASFRTPMHVTIEGPVQVVPSNYLDMELEAWAVTTAPVPPAAFLAVDLPFRGMRFVPEVSWIGWSSYYSFESQLEDFEISSGDAAMQGILESYGLTEAEFLAGAGGATSTTGMHDVFNVGLSAWLPLADRWTSRLGAWWLPGAVPDETVHPGNLDFDSLNLRGAVAWTPARWVRVGLGADWYASPTRVITTSAHQQVGAEPPGALLPSGNGSYSLVLARLGLTVELLHRAAGAGRGADDGGPDAPSLQ